MNLEVTQLAENMIMSMHDVLSEQWPQVREYAEAEARKLAETLTMLERLKELEKIDNEVAGIHLDIQKNACRTALLAVDGLTLVAVEATLNAALDIVKAPVNCALESELI